MSLAPNGQNHTKADSLVENIYIRILSRFAMIIATFLLPIVAYLGKERFDRADIDNKEAIALIKELSSEARKNREDIIEIKGEIKLSSQKDQSQDEFIRQILIKIETIASNYEDKGN